jgi:hypothetical protein
LPQPDPQLLGALYAVSAVLLLLVLLGVGAAVVFVGWLRSYERGSVSWHPDGVDVKLAEKQVRSAEVRQA